MRKKKKVQDLEGSKASDLTSYFKVLPDNPVELSKGSWIKNESSERVKN
jgi:hypothetical protein